MANNINKAEVTFEVEKINTSRAYVLAELERLYPLLEKFVGQKIVLANGDYSKKFDLKINRIEPNVFSGWFSASKYSLSIETNTWFPQGVEKIRASRDKKISVWIGNLEDGVLISLDKKDEIIERLSLDVVMDVEVEINKIDMYLTAKKEAERLQSLIGLDREIYKYF